MSQLPQTPYYCCLKGSRATALWLVLLITVGGIGMVSGQWVGGAADGRFGLYTRVPWGLPHVIAFFMVLGAPGALHVATLGSLGGGAVYRDWSRLGLAVGGCLLIGGLSLLVLDLGKSDRLLIALRHFNSSSVFAWNILFYNVFILTVVLASVVLINPGLTRLWRPVALLTLLTRLCLTTATVSIFAVLVGRAVLPLPLLLALFFSMSWLIGTSVVVLYRHGLVALARRSAQDDLIATGVSGDRLVIQTGWLAGVTLCIAIACFGWAGFSAAHRDYALALLQLNRPYLWLLGGFAGACLIAFWLALRLHRQILNDDKSVAYRRKSIFIPLCASVAGLCMTYTIVISVQAWQVPLFADRELLPGSLITGFAGYRPSVAELIFSSTALSIPSALLLAALRVLPLLPDYSNSEFSRQRQLSLS